MADQAVGSKPIQQVSPYPPPANVSLTWYKTYSGGNETDTGIGYAVRQTRDGGYVIAGMKALDNGWGHSVGRLIKTDAVGNEEWNRTFDGSGNLSLSDVQQTSDGGYIVAGSEYWDGYPFLIKTDANGATIWKRSIGHFFDDATSVIQAADGGYVMTGKTYTNGAGDVYLAKIDPNGIPVWYRTFGGPGDDAGNSVQQTADGGYVIAGYYAKSPIVAEWDMYLVKTDADGVEQWAKNLGGSANEYGYSVQQTIDGGYILSGSSASSDEVDVILIKTDASGNSLWDQAYQVYQYDYGFSVRQTRDGGFIVAGNSDPYGSPFLIKTNASGNEMWVKTFGVEFDYAFSVIQSSDGGYVVTGDTYSAGGLDPFLAKIDEVTSQTFNISLHQGWNLISLPLSNDTLKASQFEGTSVVRVASYNEKDGYDTYVVGFSSTDLPIRNDYAYFIDSSAATTFTLYGETVAAPHPVTLSPGWNAVGWSGLDTVRASDLCSQSAAIQRVCRYNSASGAYDTYVNGFSGDDKNFDVKPGEGYFIYIESSTPVQLNEGGI